MQISSKNVLNSDKNYASSISFRAKINTNYINIKEALLFDRYFDAQGRRQIKSMIDKVEKLSSLKEKSNVVIQPRLDNNQLNLITTVTDKTNKVRAIITERSARKMVSDENFASRFINNVKQAIINVEKTRKELKSISNFIEKSAHLEDDGFVDNLATHFLSHLNKGYNPSKRIIDILEKIDKANNKGICKISLKNIKKNGGVKKMSTVRTYFSLKNSDGEKLLPIASLLKDPAQKLFV